MKICPCCGSKSANTEATRLVCLACGAQSVGEPLPRPERELPSYARSLVLMVTGSLMVLVFLTQTVIALADVSARGAKSTIAAFSMLPTDLWAWVAAGETAAWRLKWVMIPVTLFVVFACRKLYASIKQSPANFCGLGYARRGYAAALAVPLLVLILIGITVPERLRQRAMAKEAGVKASGYRVDRALNEYREKFETLPSELKDLRKLPDPDGSLAAALKDIDVSGYTANSELAAAPTRKPRTLRGAVILNASVAPAEDTLSGGISFTNYELRLPGADKIMNNDDDLILIDGVTYRVPELPRRGVNATSASQKRRP